MAGAIALDRESCQFPFVLDEKPAVVPSSYETFGRDPDRSATKRDTTRPCHSLETNRLHRSQAPKRVITELMRFEFPMNCDDENVAISLGIARRLLDSSFRDFAIARYESEKRMIMQSRRR
jgi:hypothetical protein